MLFVFFLSSSLLSLPPSSHPSPISPLPIYSLSLLFLPHSLSKARKGGGVGGGREVESESGKGKSEEKWKAEAKKWRNGKEIQSHLYNRLKSLDSLILFFTQSHIRSIWLITFG